MSATQGGASPGAPASAEHQPYIADDRNIQESTIPALLIGSVLGIVYAASSVFLALRIGMTVSASIPIAVLSITIFRFLSKGNEPRILVNNIVQTVGSAGESIAAGVAFTLPSLLLMGFEMEIWRILLVGLLGGILGVLMMIPLRHGLIVKEHGKLSYPEGTACAQVLIAGEQGGANAKTVFQGFGVGIVHGALTWIFKFWKDVPTWIVPRGKALGNACMAGDLNGTTLGVGYIIGYETSAVMMAGGILSFIVLVPLITHFGDALTIPFGPHVTQKIADMDAYAIRDNYILYIGAGAVATGGFISLARSLPTIFSAFRRGLGDLGAAKSGGTRRTQQDLPMRVVIFGSLALVVAITLAPVLNINLVSAILIVFFGFFFVTVSSRITGEIGSSSNPISGMTIATLLITCLLFVLAGWTGVNYKEMALTTAALVCVAASNGGTISQDLKTGFLVGATPRKQQIAILVGVVTSAVIIGFTMLRLNEGAQTIAPKAKTYASFTATPESLANAKREMHDDKSYRVLFLSTETGGVPRGKYLVDDAGKIAYVVDPGVCGTEPWRVKAPGANAPGYSKLAPAGKDDRHCNVDGVDYRVATDPQTNSTYAVDDAKHEIVYAASEVRKFDAPKAHLFQLIIDGILGGELPWTLVLIGVFLAIMLELVGVSSLPFAVGAYLPIETSTPIFVGGLIRKWVDKKTKVGGADAEFAPGTLMASGLIAGASIASLVSSNFSAGWSETAEAVGKYGFNLVKLITDVDIVNNPLTALVPFAVMCAILWKVGMSAKPSPAKA